MRTFCITFYCKYMNSNIITIRLSNDAITAYRFLQSKKINPAKYLRSGGEQLVIQMAQKNKFTFKKLKLPFWLYTIKKRVVFSYSFFVSDILYPNAYIICRYLSIPNECLPASTLAICGCFIPHFSASCSWVSPSDTHGALMLKQI